MAFSRSEYKGVTATGASSGPGTNQTAVDKADISPCTETSWQAVVRSQHQADAVGGVADDDALRLDDSGQDRAGEQGVPRPVQDQAKGERGQGEAQAAVLGFEGGEPLFAGGSVRRRGRGVG